MAEGESITNLLEFSVLPVAKVLCMCSLGLLMASSYINILTASARKQVSQLVFKVFLPCLIFTELGKAVTLEKIVQWWFIPVNVLISSTLGCLLGLLVAFIVKPPPNFFKFTFVMIGIGNIGNIPLVLIGAICRDNNNPFGEPQACETDGIAYISFGQWVGAVIVYTFVYDMLAPPRNVDSLPNSEAAQAEAEADPENGTSSDVTVPLLEGEGQADVNGLLFSNKTKARIQSWIKAARLAEILQPPVAASILALVFGTTPFLKHLFLESHSVFYFLSDSFSMLGGAMIPCILLVLGGNLIRGPGASTLGLKTTLAITAVRLLLVPPIGIGVVTLADKLGFLPAGNKMFRFVCLLHYTMPTSILAGAVTNLHGYAEQEAAAILFWEHIAAVITMTGWLAVYLNFLL